MRFPHRVVDTLERLADDCQASEFDGRLAIVEVPPAGWPELDGLIEALQSSDSYTVDHSRRVSNYARNLAGEYGLFKDEVETIDVGVRILERTGAFVDYLSIVSLHHENHQGSG